MRLVKADPPERWQVVKSDDGRSGMVKDTQTEYTTRWLPIRSAIGYAKHKNRVDP